MAQGGQGTTTGQATDYGRPTGLGSADGLGTPTGNNPYAGYGGGYGPTGAMSGPDLSNMAYKYGSSPQNLAGQMQYQGISPFNMSQAGVISPENYTKMYRPSSQTQQGINKTQTYQPIYQQQFQNYGSPEYSPMANANNMGAYNMLSQANMGPATSLASQSTFDPYSGTFNTPYGQTSGLGQLIGSAGTPYALSQQQAAMNPFANLNPSYAWQQQQGGQQGWGQQGGDQQGGDIQQDGQGYQPVTETQGTEYDPSKVQGATDTTAADTDAYKYDTYANYKPEELAGFNRNQVTNLYNSRLATTQKDIKQAQLDYNKALKKLDDVNNFGAIFDPESQLQLKTLGNVAGYTQFHPRGSFVNNSNTLVGYLANKAAGGVEQGGNIVGLKTFGYPLGSEARRVIRASRERKEAAEALKPGAGSTLDEISKTGQ